MRLTSRLPRYLGGRELKLQPDMVANILKNTLFHICLFEVEQYLIILVNHPPKES